MNDQKTQTANQTAQASGASHAQTDSMKQHAASLDGENGGHSLSIALSVLEAIGYEDVRTIGSPQNDDAQKIAPIISEAFSKWVGHPDIASLAQERDDLLRKIELTDRMLRNWRRAYFDNNPPNTWLAGIFNDILRTLGTFEPDHIKNAEREANAGRT